MTDAGCRALLAIAVLTPLCASAEVTRETDRFDGSIRIESKLYKVPSGQVMPQFLHFRLKGKTSPVIDSGILLVMTSESWRYLRCHRVRWLADGVAFELPDATHRGDVGNGYVIEFLTIKSIPVQRIRNLAKANKIEFQICNDEFAFTDRAMSDLRDFARMIVAP